jgi:hypothetical protein
LHLLFIGDIVGSGGRKLLKARLPDLRKRYQIDFCVANAENTAAGLGLTGSLAREIVACGADILTLGNHSWARQELIDSIESIPFLIRPANGPAAWPGKGHILVHHPLGKILVINMLGRVFMDPVNDPFVTVDQILDDSRIREDARIVIVDFHAEATSEKNAFAWHVDGRVTLVAGTHTHVQTADERILERGTAFITDVGMTGPTDGVIGMEKEASLRRFVDHLPAHYELARGPSAICAVVVDADPATGRARRIERVRIEE